MKMVTEAKVSLNEQGSREHSAWDVTEVALSRQGPGGDRGQVTFCTVLRTPGKRRCRGVTVPQPQQPSAPERKLRVLPNSAVRAARDLGHRLPLHSRFPSLKTESQALGERQIQLGDKDQLA